MERLYEYSGGLVSLVVSLLHDAQEIAIITGSESLNLASLNEAFQKRTAMLHGYLERYIIKLPVTTKAKATPHISKKYRIQKKNTRQISRV